MSYRVTYTTLPGGAIIGELPVSDLTFSTVLNAPGSFSATLPLDHAHGCGIDAEALSPGRVAVFIERDNVCLWSGILWTMELDVKANSARLNGEGWLSYFRRRFIKADLSYTATDQTTIAAALIDYAQSATGGDVGIVTDPTATGVLRDRSFVGTERKEIGEAVEQLAEVRDGFHFAFVSDRQPTGFRTRFVTGYPETGRPTDVVFDLNSNMELLTATVDGTALTNSVEIRGAGEGAAALTYTAEDATSFTTTPLLETVESFTDVSEVATLTAKAQHRLNLGRSPLVIPTIKVDPDGDPPLGSYFTGDRVRVRGRLGILDLDADFIITSVEVSAGPSAETVGLSFAPVEAFTDA